MLSALTREHVCFGCNIILIKRPFKLYCISISQNTIAADFIFWRRAIGDPVAQRDTGLSIIAFEIARCVARSEKKILQKMFTRMHKLTVVECAAN